MSSESTKPGQLPTGKSISNGINDARYVMDQDMKVLFAATKDRAHTRSIRSGQCEWPESQICTTASSSQWNSNLFPEQRFCMQWQWSTVPSIQWIYWGGLEAMVYWTNGHSNTHRSQDYPLCPWIAEIHVLVSKLALERMLHHSTEMQTWATTQRPCKCHLWLGLAYPNLLMNELCPTAISGRWGLWEWPYKQTQACLSEITAGV